MNDLSDTIARALICSVRDFAQRVHSLAEKLSPDQFWAKPYPYGNSFGHLVLHLTGNLNYYIGSQIAGTGYVRDREREFNDADPPAKEEALKQLDEAVALLISVVEKQTAVTWSNDYEAALAADFVKDRFSIFLRCATHCHHHLGQMINLEQEFSQVTHDNKL